MSRVKGKDGNVVSVDFGNDHEDDESVAGAIEINLETEVLYVDDAVVLARCTLSLPGSDVTVSTHLTLDR